MTLNEIYSQLTHIVSKDCVKIYEPMKKHTTLAVGGNADILVEASTVDEIVKIFNLSKKLNLGLTVIGRGSNLLVRDNGISGIVLKIADTFTGIEKRDESLIIKSGTSVAEVSKFALKHSLTGIEFASGIPGTIGGAITMNAGAYGGEMKDVVEWVEVLDTLGKVRKIKNQYLDFRYRKSLFTEKSGYIILSAKLNLKKGSKESIYAEMISRNKKRVKSQPLHMNNCGSTFKRPDGHFVGKLLEDCGLKGFSRNGVEISSKHAGFIVNNGNVTAKDMLDMIQIAKDTVLKEFNIQLEEEVRIIGN